jgi:hypothetical protein
MKKLIILMQQPKVFIPAEEVSKILEMSRDVFNNDEELGFIRSCLYYLMEGVSAEHAIDMAMIDYLIDL